MNIKNSMVTMRNSEINSRGATMYFAFIQWPPFSLPRCEIWAMKGTHGGREEKFIAFWEEN